METLLFYHTLVPSLSTISPFSPLFLHTQEKGSDHLSEPFSCRQAPERGEADPVNEPGMGRLPSNRSNFRRMGNLRPEIHKKFMKRTRFCNLSRVFYECTQEEHKLSPISPSPLQQHTQQKAPALCRGLLSLPQKKFTNRSRRRHDSAMFSGYPILVPGSQKTISHFSLSFTITHTAESPGRRPGFFVPSGYQNSQIVQEEDMIPQSFSGILYSYQEDRTTFPISPSPLQQHTQQRAPAPCRGFLYGRDLEIHKTFMNRS